MLLNGLKGIYKAGRVGYKAMSRHFILAPETCLSKIRGVPFYSTGMGPVLRVHICVGAGTRWDLLGTLRLFPSVLFEFCRNWRLT
jgi:hypothetical protein